MNQERFDALKIKIQAVQTDRNDLRSRLQVVADRMKALPALMRLLPAEIKEKLGLS